MRSVLVICLLFSNCYVFKPYQKPIPFEPAKKCQEPIYLPDAIPNNAKVLAAGVRKVEKNNRDCFMYVQDVAVKNSEAAQRNLPDSVFDFWAPFVSGFITATAFILAVLL